jgi:hypothetical protein
MVKSDLSILFYGALSKTMPPNIDKDVSILHQMAWNQLIHSFAGTYIAF